MLNLVSKLSAAFLIAAVSGTTMAQAPISSPEPARVPTKAETDYNNEIVCEQTEVIGSRLAKKKVCMTVRNGRTRNSRTVSILKRSRFSAL